MPQSPQPNDPRAATSWIEVSRSSDRRTSRNHALVLQSMGLPHGILESEGQFHVVVRPEFAARAGEEIARYERENVGWPPRESIPAPISQGIHAAILYGGILVLVYTLQHAGRYGIDWAEIGRAEAARIRAGEWWRAITALTLHVDLPHLAGNVVFGAAFGIILAQSVGVGIAWWGFLLSGALGNLLNAWLQSPDHRSIGASTAVFGALGLQVAFEWMRRGELSYRGWRRWAPLVMGAALLGWLGTGGASIDDPKRIESALDRVDVMAHVLGFAAGLAMGVGLGLRRKWLRLKSTTQFLVASAVPAALGVAWMLAILHG